MTPTQNWLKNRYYSYKLFANLWFMSAVWLYFYRIFITDQQVGWLDGIAFAIGLVAEIPSGALADKFGRDKLMRVGQILAGGGTLLQAFGSGFSQFFIGQAILMIGVAFVSGADEALFFERLNFDKSSKAWRKLVMRGSQVALAGTLAATLLGGWLHNINPRLPWILCGASFLISALVIWPVKDGRLREQRQAFRPEMSIYLKSIKAGIAEFRLPKLWIYAPFIFVIQGLFFTAGYGLLRIVLLNRFNFSPWWGSVVIALCGLITIILLSIMHKHADRLSEKRVLSSVGLAAVVALLLSVGPIGKWGLVVMFILYAGEHLLIPFMSETINYHASEDQRATVLSVASFLKTLAYVILAPVIGYLNTIGKLEYFLIFWSVLSLMVIFIYLAKKRTDDKIRFGIADA